MERKDFYFRKAKKEGFLARSIYKLLEINRKYQIISRNSRILDLGCSPGSWTQACLKLKAGKIVGIDLDNAKVKAPNFTFIKEDINKIDIEKLEKFDIVLSDLAPSTSGNKDLDSEKSLQLASKALEIAKKVLKKDGNFLVKIFQGENFDNFLKEVKKEFYFCKSYKPKSTRKNSKEIYIVAKNFGKAI